MSKSGIGFLFGALLFSSCQVIQPKHHKPFSGMVTYAVTYPNSSLLPSVQQQLPKKMTIWLQWPYVKTTLQSDYFIQHNFKNLKTKETVTYLRISGQSYKLIRHPVDAATTDSTAFVFTGKTIKIDSHTCLEAIGYPSQDTVYVAKKIPVNNLYFDHPQWARLDRLLLDFTQNQGGIKIRYEAQQIEKKKLNPDIFRQPEGYQLIEKEKLFHLYNQ
jgi:hypothetical protein